ncbi:MAG TPA: ABC transporter substrate-binding protein, partial [Clostridiales bacterium]|nr:ABC transporter substrate-binding protein [Clostridiales bacterium]
ETGDEVIKIGVLMPLSGATASPGAYQLEGIQMVVDYVNENGGIKSMNGAKIELVVSDTAGNVETGMTEIERLITVENVSALIGPYNSTVGAATAPIAIQYGIPYVITNAIADNIMQNGANKYVYRSNYGANDMTPFRKMVVDYLGGLSENGKFSKIAIIYDAGDWGTSENASFQEVAKAIDAEVVVSEAITTNSSDLSSVVNKIKNSGAEVIFAGIFLNDAILFTKQMREYNCNIQIVGSGTGFSDSKWLEALGEAGNGVMGTSDFNPSFGVRNPDAAELYDAYLKEHDNVPMPLETSNGWCGMGTLVEALEAAGSADREAIADALYNLDLESDSLPLWFSMFEGIKFNTEGDELQRYNQNIRLGETAGQILKQVINGKWELVWPTDHATAQATFGM